MTNDDTGRTPAEFGARLRSLRQAAGLSQTDLATDGLSPSYVSLIESGKRPASATVITILARRLGVDEQFLTTGVDAEAGAALELEVAYGEIALRNGDPQQALELFEEARRIAKDANYEWGVAINRPAVGVTDCA